MTVLESIRAFLDDHFHHFNAREVVDAAKAWEAHRAAGGKMLVSLAGAAVVQVCSALYENDFPYLGRMLDELRDWMLRKEFDSIAAFRGRLSQRASENPAAYERVQFMKATAGIE